MMNTAATMPMITKTPANTPPTIAASELSASASAVAYIIKRQKRYIMLIVHSTVTVSFKNGNT